MALTLTLTMVRFYRRDVRRTLAASTPPPVLIGPEVRTPGSPGH